MTRRELPSRSFPYPSGASRFFSTFLAGGGHGARGDPGTALLWNEPMKHPPAGF